MEAFGIFEGGGVRGIALVGALEVAINNYDYQFIGTAGTSAGAILAALYAAKWPVDEIEYEINNKSFVDFLDGFDRMQAERGVDEFLGLATGLSGNWLKKLAALPQLLSLPRNLQELIKHLANNYGVFQGDAFETWLDSCLSRYLGKSRVAFEDIQTPLKIVASNLNSQEPIVFSQKNWPEKPVAQAVRASISIPFFFSPKLEGSDVLVDGGLMSNFPAWVFDEEREKIGISVPTIGFRLVEEKGSNRINDIYEFAKAVLSTGLGGYRKLQTRGVENLIELPIPTRGISFIKFDLSAQEKSLLLDSGRQVALEVLSKIAQPKADWMIVSQLKSACNDIREIVGKDKHLRANVFLPSGRGKVKIFYQHNMDVDSDRQLEFDIDAGVTGRCWDQKKIQIADLTEISRMAQKDPKYSMEHWKFPPQIQAAIRPTLKSLLSVPIFDPRDYDSISDTGTLIGVLNFDSDNSIPEVKFGNAQVVEIAKRCAEIVANLLKP